MSQHEEAVRRAYDALLRGQLETFLDFIDPDVEFNSLIPRGGKPHLSGPRGRAGMVVGGQGVHGGIKSEIEETREPTPDTVLVRATVRGSVRGVPVEQGMWQAVLFGEGGTAVWWHFARTDEEALEALNRRLEARE